MASALDTALLLARKFDSCIEGFPLRPAVADLVAMDPDSGLTMVAVKENDAEMVRQAEDMFRSFMENHQVAATQRRRAGIVVLVVAQGRAERPRFRRQLWPGLRHDRAGAAGRRMAKPVHDHAGIRLVRKRPPGADRAAHFAAHRSAPISWSPGTTAPSRRAPWRTPCRSCALAERITILHRRRRDGRRAERRANGAFAEDERHRRRDDDAQAAASAAPAKPSSPRPTSSAATSSSRALIRKAGCAR